MRLSLFKDKLETKLKQFFDMKPIKDFREEGGELTYGGERYYPIEGLTDFYEVETQFHLVINTKLEISEIVDKVFEALKQLNTDLESYEIKNYDATENQFTVERSLFTEKDDKNLNSTYFLINLKSQLNRR